METAILIDCFNCDSNVESTLYGQFELLNSPSVLFSLLKCKKCFSPVLIKQNNVGNMAIGDKWSEPLTLFPNTPSLILLNYYDNIPDEIVRAYEDAKNSFKAKAYTASVIMCRKIIEGIAQLNDCKEDNLKKSIDKLHTKKIIDNKLKEWANELRLAGNDAAHDINISLKKFDVNDIIEFTKSFIEYIYLLETRFQRFKKRRSQLKK